MVPETHSQGGSTDGQQTTSECTGDLPPPIVDELHRFEQWMRENSNLKDSSASNYLTCVEAFYQDSSFCEPFDEQDHESRDRMAKELNMQVATRSQVYGLKKYLGWRAQQTVTSEQRKNVLVFDDNLDKIRDNTVDTSTMDGGEKFMNHKDVRESIRVADDYGDDDTGRQIQLALAFMYETAARIGDAAKVEWNDIFREQFQGQDLKDNQIVIDENRSKSKNSGKADLNPKTYKRLVDIYNERDATMTDRVFFPDRTVDATKQVIRRGFYHALVEADVVPEWKIERRSERNDVPTPHWLRDSRLMHMGQKLHRDKGWSYDRVKERLRKYARHESADTTEDYYIKPLKNRQAEDIPDDVVGGVL